jgi:hypothetical protein
MDAGRRCPPANTRKEKEAMEEYEDVNAMFDLLRTPGGISPVEKLLNEFEAHESKEEKALEFYRNTLDRLPNPLTRFLMQLRGLFTIGAVGR